MTEERNRIEPGLKIGTGLGRDSKRLEANTHDAATHGRQVQGEFNIGETAVAFADRVVLMGDGTIIADGPPEAILAGGWYFATETARILRQFMYNMDEIAALEMVLKSMKATKTHVEFFDMMRRGG